MSKNGGTNIGLFVTCLVDLIRPSVGFAAVALLEHAGFTVEVPRGQTCCGQPAYNSGDRSDACAIAQRVIDAFAGYTYVVVPSGSCAGMLKEHYVKLLADDPVWARKAQDFSEKVYEIVSFLSEVAKVDNLPGNYTGRVTYHDSCSNLRELGVQSQPRALLEMIEGIELVEMPETEICCGFGGLFSVKYPDISNAMVTRKVGNVMETNTDMVLAGDLGCLMNIAGKLRREGKPVAARHIVELLAGMLDEPPIGGHSG